MALESGTYTLNREKTVTVWKAPDVNGDSEEVWEDQYDGQGRHLGRATVKDRNGNAVKKYSPPDGFRNVPTSTQQESWTKVDSNGQIYRNNAGEALVIKPGSALVEHSDGSWELLEDEYAQYQFELAHTKTGSVSVEATK